MRPMIVRTITFLAAMASVAAGCSLGSAGTHTNAPTHPAVALAHYRGGGVAFSYPAAWSHRGAGSGDLGSLTGGVIDLSTQAMGNPCHTAGNVTSCGFPLARLRPGGVFAAWIADYEMTNPAHPPPAGRHVSVTKPGFCSRIGATETIVARVVTSSHAMFSLQACLRSPGLVAGERAVKAMVASARATRPAPALLAFHGDGVSFRYPAAWSHHRPGVRGFAMTGVVDLSTQPLRNPCHRIGRVTSCGLPIRRLRRGGVVVVWVAPGLPGVLQPRGVTVTVTHPGHCRRIGGDESIAASVTRKHRTLWVDACLRGPDLQANERAVRAMLASAL
jgi:hypothetical protein